MKRKRLLAAGLSLALVAAVTVAGTLAYFTDSTDAKTNTFTVGHVDIDVVDKSDQIIGDTTTIDEKVHRVVHGVDTPAPGAEGLTYEHVLPGDVVDKTVGVTLKEGSMDAWVAVKVAVNVTLPNGSALNKDDVADEILGLIDATDEWDVVQVLDAEKQPVPGEAIFYCNTPVSAVDAYGDAADVTKTLFTQLVLPGEEWNNDYADLGFDIAVEAAAVQADNVTLGEFKAMDWASMEEYTAPAEP